MKDLDVTVLDRVTGGQLQMELCRAYDHDAHRVGRAGLRIAAKIYRAEAAGCREEYRAENPGILGTLRSWF